MAVVLSWTRRILVIAGATLLSGAGPAAADDMVVRGTVAPGDLILESVYFSYPYESCYDASPTVEPAGWYEDLSAVRIPGSDFSPIVARRTTSADVGFYVDDDAVDGYVVLDLYVVYDGCPDGSVKRVHHGLHRWRVDTSLERDPVPMPAGGIAGTVGLAAVSAGSFAVGQCRSARRRQHR